MYSDMEGVLDRLAKSAQLQAIQCGMALTPESTLLEKIVNLHGLRAVYLSSCDQDWSVLVKMPSLRTITLRSCPAGLLDCSPLMETAFLKRRRVLTQEWRRTGSEQPPHLFKFGYRSDPDEKTCESLSLETHLEHLATFFSQPLLGVLPLCRSIRSLDIDNINSQEQIDLLSEVLLLAPFIHSLSLDVFSPHLKLSSLPLSSLRSFKLVSDSSLTDFSLALTKSKPKSLTYLKLEELDAGFEPLSLALLECPSLTNLNMLEFQISNQIDDFLPVARMLNRLPLARLTLKLLKFTDESIEALLSFLSGSTVQDLKLGTLSPKQLQLVADALPSLSCLQSLDFDSIGYRLCQHESSHLALFSALTSSSLRSLTLRFCFFRRSVLDSCLDKILKTQLTRVHLINPFVYEDGFDATIHDDNYEQADLYELLNWDHRFPQIKDRFCHISWCYSR
jgi:hypothetical protein